MPPAGGAARGQALGALQSLAHERLVAPELGALLDAENGDDPQLVRAVRRDHEVARRVPGELAAEMARAGSDGFEVWLAAREANDFALFEPALRRNIELARAYAGVLPRGRAPLRRAARPLRARHDDRAGPHALRRRCATGSSRCSPRSPRSPRRRRSTGGFPVAAQREVGLEIVHAMGFDESAWRLDDAVHPFAASPSSHDVRVTSRFDDESLTGLFALMHEVGHGLYEHGIDPALARTTLDTGVSLGVHESQSRHVGEPRRPQRAVLEPLAAAPARGDARDARRRRARRLPARDQRRRADAHPRRGRRADVLAARHPALRARARAHRGHARRGRPARRRGRRRCARCSASRCPTTCAASCRTSTGPRGSSATSRRTRSATSSPRSSGAPRAPTCRGSTTTCAPASTRNLRAWLVEKVHRHGRRLTPPELIEQAVGGPLDPAPMLEHLSAKYRALYGLSAAYELAARRDPREDRVAGQRPDADHEPRRRRRRRTASRPTRCRRAASPPG